MYGSFSSAQRAGRNARKEIPHPLRGFGKTDPSAPLPSTTLRACRAGTNVCPTEQCRRRRGAEKSRSLDSPGGLARDGTGCGSLTADRCQLATPGGAGGDRLGRSATVALPLRIGGADEGLEERVGVERLGLELRVELAAEEPGAGGEFDNFAECALGGATGQTWPRW